MSQKLKAESPKRELEEHEVAIRVEGVSKTFRLPHEKSGSIKSLVVHPFNRKRGYELQKALNDVSFEIKKGEFFGIVGRNGSGKSTLLKLLAGIYTPSKGSIQVNGKLTPFIELGVGFNPELTGRENVYLNGALLGFNRKEMRAMYNDIVEFAELEKFMDQKLKNYSSGMQVRLAFSLATKAKTDILLVDEVLAVGDADFQRKCFKYFKELKKQGKTVVFVSHDMGAVREFCDKGILINSGKLKVAGTSKIISKEYAMLFMGDPDNNQSSKSSKRMGTWDVKIKKVETKVSADEISIKVLADVNKEIDKLIYGLHILGPDGVELTAMNNRMMLVDDITDLKKGETVQFNWKMLNIFSDGKYSVMLTLVDDAYTQLDYFEDAGSFTVKREQRSNTAIHPPVSVEHIVR